MKDYVALTYSQDRLPLTLYPGRLTRYLFDCFHLKAGDKLLDVGCGRGEFLRGFIDCGLIGFCVDLSFSAESYCPNAILNISDIENDGILYDDNSSDVVFSKSVIEHFYYP
jgi:cyclopropane fatty-acyl-phospholipid synthase-like methyltransferase